jgi:hypothetical protein
MKIHINEFDNRLLIDVNRIVVYSKQNGGKSSLISGWIRNKYLHPLGLMVNEVISDTLEGEPYYKLINPAQVHTSYNNGIIHNVQERQHKIITCSINIPKISFIMDGIPEGTSEKPKDELISLLADEKCNEIQTIIAVYQPYIDHNKTKDNELMGKIFSNVDLLFIGLVDYGCIKWILYTYNFSDKQIEDVINIYQDLCKKKLFMVLDKRNHNIYWAKNT